MTDAQREIIARLDQILAATGGGGGGAAWGDITGTLGDQSDLATALGLKQTAAQVQALIDAAVPYLVYTALLTQSGTDAPVATVLQNTLGGTVVWTYNNAGIYEGTLVGAFTVDKTACVISGATADGLQPSQAILFRNSADTVKLTTAKNDNTSLEDGHLQGATVQILVYP